MGVTANPAAAAISVPSADSAISEVGSGVNGGEAAAAALLFRRTGIGLAGAVLDVLLKAGPNSRASIPLPPLPSTSSRFVMSPSTPPSPPSPPPLLPPPLASELSLRSPLVSGNDAFDML